MEVVEQFDEMRAAFERWLSDDGEWPRAIERTANGDYRLLHAASSWATWKAAWSAARDPA